MAQRLKGQKVLVKFIKLQPLALSLFWACPAKTIHGGLDDLSKGRRMVVVLEGAADITVYFKGRRDPAHL